MTIAEGMTMALCPYFALQFEGTLSQEMLFSSTLFRFPGSVVPASYSPHTTMCIHRGFKKATELYPQQHVKPFF
jgi:hypothetical protein